MAQIRRMWKRRALPIEMAIMRTPWFSSKRCCRIIELSLHRLTLIQFAVILNLKRAALIQHSKRSFSKLICLRNLKCSPINSQWAINTPPNSAYLSSNNRLHPHPAATLSCNNSPRPPCWLPKCSCNNNNNNNNNSNTNNKLCSHSSKATSTSRPTAARLTCNSSWRCWHNNSSSRCIHSMGNGSRRQSTINRWPLKSEEPRRSKHSSW